MTNSAKSAVIEAACRVIQDNESNSPVGHRPTVISTRLVSGGCINQALKLETDTGNWFVKYSNAPQAHAMLQAEQLGLQRLAVAGPLATPAILGCAEFSTTGADDCDAALLVLEWIEPSSNLSSSSSFWESFGRGLAELHLAKNRSTAQKHYGFDHDNWIGTTPQPNKSNSSWIDFWRDHRLQFQLNLARDKGYLDAQNQRRGHQLCDSLDTILTEPASPSLLHGDLWSGNFLSDQDNRPVLIDPASYYGHPEAEFGMITLFGGFDQRFFDAYHEVLPQSGTRKTSGGFSERVEIYKLYHLLNHLNLFGQSYLNSCVATLRRFT